MPNHALDLAVRPVMIRGFVRTCGTVIMMWAAPAVYAQAVEGRPANDRDLPPTRVEESISRGVAFLKRSHRKLGVREDSLVMLALAKALVPPDDPLLAKLVAGLKMPSTAETTGPARDRGRSVYELSSILMALVAIDADGYADQIESNAALLIGKQFPSGAWDYPYRGQGDTSFTQFALVALWEASQSGVVVPGKVWDDAAQWHIAKQDESGGFAYHPDENRKPRHSTTVAALSSMLVCREQLGFKPIAERSRLLVPVTDEPGFTTRTNSNALDRSIAAAATWLASNFTIESPPTRRLFYLYGLERYGDMSSNETIAGRQWYREGADYLISSQSSTGAWKGDFTEVVSTSVALLFLTRSMRQSLEKSSGRGRTLLGRGELVSGRGRPKELGRALPATRRTAVFDVRPLEGSVEQLLQWLEEGGVADIAGAAAGIREKVMREGGRVVTEHASDFEKLSRHADAEVRKVAFWAIARGGDYQSAPLLIQGLRDRDSAVRHVARDALRVLARKPLGFGLPDDPTDDELKDAIRQWGEWYEAVSSLYGDE